MSILVLALDGVFDLGLAAVLDTFGTATALGGHQTVRCVGVRRRVRTGQGWTVPVADARALARPDLVIVPAISAKMPDTLRVALERPDVADAGAILRRWADRGTLVAAACTGTFVLAKSGLLDGRTATTSWWLAPLFRELFPRVEVDESRMIVDAGGRVTAGAALAHLDLALWLLRRQSPQLASLVARYLVTDQRPSQAAYIIPDHLAHTDPIVERFEAWARRRLADRFSLSDASRGVGASSRTLARRLRAVLGKSPLSYVQDLRVERAVHRLKTSDATVEEIAAEVGYADGVTLRALLRRKTGRGLRELRLR